MRGFLRKFGVAALAVLALLFLTLAPAAAAKPVVTEWEFPCLGLFTGAYAYFGVITKFAVDYAVNEINAAGGIAGVPVKVTYYDTARDANKGRAQLAKVIDKSLVIWGPMDDVSVIAGFPMCLKEGVFCFTPVCGPVTVKPFMPNAALLMDTFDNMIPGPINAWLKLNPDIKTAVQFIDRAVGDWMEMLKVQRRVMEAAGIKVYDDVEISAGVDPGAAVIKAMSLNPDAYCVNVGPVDAAKIIVDLEKRGLKDKEKIMIMCSADDPALFEIAAGHLDGCYHWNVQNMLSTNPKWLEVRQAYLEKFKDQKEPNFLLPQFYDMVYLTKAAIEATGATGDLKNRREEATKIKDYIRNVKNFQGLLGPYDMVDGYAKIPSALYQIKDNKKVLIGTYTVK